jgi:hypothetical protein
MAGACCVSRIICRPAELCRDLFGQGSRLALDFEHIQAALLILN